MDAAVEGFIQLHKLDEEVSKGLRELGEEGKREVISADITRARNPSAVVWSLIRSAQRGTRASGPAQPLPQPIGASYAPLPHPSVQLLALQMLQSHPEALAAVRKLQSIPGALEALQTVLAAPGLLASLGVGPLAAPYGVPGLPPPSTAPLPPPRDGQPRHVDVEEFIRRWSLDERVSKGLRELSPEQQQQVMQQDLDATRCRNPSAVMWSRVSAALKGLPLPGLPIPPANPPLPGPPYKRQREYG